MKRESIYKFQHMTFFHLRLCLFFEESFLQLFLMHLLAMPEFIKKHFEEAFLFEQERF
jgi:hypothetical protein